jgi:hypothetical protein
MARLPYHRNRRRSGAALVAAAALPFAPFAALPITAVHAAVSAAAPQEPTPAATSTLSATGARKLPAGALRVPPGHELARDAKKQLEAVAAQAGLALTKSELLLWPTGSGYKAGGRQAVSQPLAKMLEVGGLTYKEVNTQKLETGTLVVFVAMRPGKQSGGVLGMWMASDDALMLGWADASAKEKPTEAAAAPPAADAAADQSGGGAEPAAKSRVAEVRFPGGTLRLLEKDALAQTAEQLQILMKELGLTMGGNEVLIWTGSDYKPDDNAAIQSGMAEALKGAGYAYEAQPPHKSEDGTLTVFTAGREAKKEALMGFWMAGKDFLLMAWAQAKPKAGSAPSAPAPATEAATPIALEGAAPLATLAFPKIAAKPMQVTGTALDRLGKPIAGARIRFWRITDQGAFIHQEARTDATGRYSLALSGSPNWKCDNALARREWNGTVYYLPLRPEGGDGGLFDGEDIDVSRGRVLNFHLPVSGRIHAENDPKSDISYYGGSVRLDYGIANTSEHPVDRLTRDSRELPPGTKIDLTLSPVGPLMDGTRGQARRVTATVGPRRDYVGRDYLQVNDLPLGRYRIDGSLTLPDGSTVPATMIVKYAFASGDAGAPTADTPLMFAPRNDNWPQQKGGDPAQVAYTALSAKSAVTATTVELTK